MDRVLPSGMFVEVALLYCLHSHVRDGNDGVLSLHSTATTILFLRLVYRRFFLARCVWASYDAFDIGDTAP